MVSLDTTIAYRNSDSNRGTEDARSINEGLHSKVSNGEDLEKETSVKEAGKKILAFLERSKIGPKNKEIIKKYFLESKTYDVIGKEYGVTRQRVEQVINKSLRHLLKEIRDNKLEDALKP